MFSVNVLVFCVVVGSGVVSVMVLLVSFMFPAVSFTWRITVLVPSVLVSVQVFCVVQGSYWLKFLFSFASLQFCIPNVSLNMSSRLTVVVLVVAALLLMFMVAFGGVLSIFWISVVFMVTFRFVSVVL